MDRDAVEYSEWFNIMKGILIQRGSMRMNLGFRTMGGNFSVRSAALVIENNSLLVAKSDNFDCYYVVGGTVQENETSETALVRELYEETGYHWETERLVFIQERIYPVGNEMHHQIVFFYLMKKTDAVIANGVNTDQQNEHLYWLPLEDLENVNLVPPIFKNQTKKFTGQIRAHSII